MAAKRAWYLLWAGFGMTLLVLVFSVVAWWTSTWATIRAMQPSTPDSGSQNPEPPIGAESSGEPHQAARNRERLLVSALSLDSGVRIRQFCEDEFGFPDAQCSLVWEVVDEGGGIICAAATKGECGCPTSTSGVIDPGMEVWLRPTISSTQAVRVEGLLELRAGSDACVQTPTGAFVAVRLGTFPWRYQSHDLARGNLRWIACESRKQLDVRNGAAFALGRIRDVPSVQCLKTLESELGQSRENIATLRAFRGAITGGNDLATIRRWLSDGTYSQAEVVATAETCIQELEPALEAVCPTKASHFECRLAIEHCQLYRARPPFFER